MRSMGIILKRSDMTKSIILNNGNRIEEFVVLKSSRGLRDTFSIYYLLQQSHFVGSIFFLPAGGFFEKFTINHLPSPKPTTVLSNRKKLSSFLVALSIRLSMCTVHAGFRIRSLHAEACVLCMPDSASVLCMPKHVYCACRIPHLYFARRQSFGVPSSCSLSQPCLRLCDNKLDPASVLCMPDSALCSTCFRGLCKMKNDSSG